MRNGTIKAVVACSAFAVAGVIGSSLLPSGTEAPILAGYYAVLVLNTFFSIRAFAAITPKNTVQGVFDGVLALIYIALACSFGSVLQFSAFSFVLFALAIGKYAHLNTLIARKNFLRRKMRINGLGALLSAVAFVTALMGFSTLAAWMLFVFFALANVYLLGINPMYRMIE